ncbi:MAG: hypothetical protein ACI9LT_001632 [Pseudoalteromonas distincta]|jgi:hypothetical protein
MKYPTLIASGALTAALVLLPSCNRAAKACDHQPGELLLGCMDPHSAEEDARGAARAGDLRLVAVPGYSLEIPGTELTGHEASSRYGIIVVEGASDVLSDSEAEAMEIAVAYAERYNTVMMNALGVRRSSTVTAPGAPLP